LLRRPLDDLQRRRLDDHERKIVAWEETEPERRGAKPIPDRIVTSDITVESLGVLLHENPRGLTMIRPELSALFAGMNQYKAGGKGNDRQFFLSLWDGEVLAVDRKSFRDGMPLYIMDPFVALVGSIQPDLLTSMRERTGQNAVADDGLLDRFLLSYPADLPVIGEQWREPSEQAITDCADIIEKLLGLTTQEIEGRRRPVHVRLTGEGKEAWQRFTEEHAAEVNMEDFPAYLYGSGPSSEATALGWR
jgi:hypothetical protein